MTKASTEMMEEAFVFDPGSMERRVFVVGCSRSGTTLLQSLLAAHPKVATFPETDFFRRVLVHAPRRKYLVRFGLATGREMKYLEGVLERFGQNDLAASVPEQPWIFQKAVNAYLAVLDHLGGRQGGRLWVEKTPLHVRHIDTIERTVPSPLFIHIIRDGREVVASIKNRSQKYPESFGGQDEKYGISTWNECIKQTKSHIHKKNHCVIKYKKMVQKTYDCMSKLGKFIGVKYEPNIIQNRKNVSSRIIESSESHKKKVYKEIKERPSKFNRMFNKKQKKEIESALDLDVFQSIVSS